MPTISEFATMPQITMTEACALYTAQNNAGNGYDLGDDDATTADAAVNAGDVILRARTTSEVWVVAPYDSLDLVLIGGDGMGRSPWAVRVTAGMLAAFRSHG
jgi:hypothetical protein